MIWQNMSVFSRRIKLTIEQTNSRSDGYDYNLSREVESGFTILR